MKEEPISNLVLAKPGSEAMPDFSEMSCGHVFLAELDGDPRQMLFMYVSDNDDNAIVLHPLDLSGCHYQQEELNPTSYRAVAEITYTVKEAR